MVQHFETGCASIDLSGPLWNVTAVVSLYVRRNRNETFDLFRDPDCLIPFVPADMSVYAGVRTGLYFYIAHSPEGTTFSDGLDGRANPVIWPGATDDLPPATITYGKILADCSACSMMDNHGLGPAPERHDFDLMIDFKGHRYSLRRHLSVDSVDPTIVEKGEEPPGSGGGG